MKEQLLQATGLFAQLAILPPGTNVPRARSSTAFGYGFNYPELLGFDLHATPEKHGFLSFPALRMFKENLRSGRFDRSDHLPVETVELGLHAVDWMEK